MNDSLRKLLIVDDDPSNIHLLASIFDESYEIAFAMNGKKALEIATQQRPDLILLDVAMPEMNGYEVCKCLKKDTLTADIPIIFVTAHSNISEEIYGLELGAADYIKKPFNMASVKVRAQNQIELKIAREKLAHLAITDGLTGIANRRYFDLQLSQEWQRAYRTNQPLAITIIDVDWFKKYNDYYGHQAGDDCLKRVALLLSECAKRNSDLVARYGGEEFIMILPSTTGNTALNISQHACQKFDSLNVPHALSNFGKVTLSAGTASTIPSNHAHSEELISFADKALYRAKDNGRNQAVLYS